MQTYIPATWSLRFSFLLFMASSLSPLSIHAEDQPSQSAGSQDVKGSVIVPPHDRLDDVSPGAAEDTLKACLGRIPEQATVGQRMMAEQTCEREEAIRQTYQGIRRL